MTPAIAANTAPMMKVAEITMSGLTPMSEATRGFSAVARMARPNLVALTNHINSASDTAVTPKIITCVGLITAPERLVQVRRNRMLSLSQLPETAYVNAENVAKEVQFSRRMFADNGWPVIDVTRRSIEETAAAVINLLNERRSGGGESGQGNKPI